MGTETVYRNYPTKGDLILAVIEDALAEATLQAEAAEAIRDPIAGLTLLLEGSISMAERYGWLAEAFLSGQLPDIQREALSIKSHKYDLAARFQRLLERALAAGVVATTLDAEVAAALLSAATAPGICRPFLSSRTPAQLALAIVTTLLGETSRG